MTGERKPLTLADREDISRGLAEELTYVQIACRIGRNPSVVSRDVARHGGRAAYRCTVAARAAALSRCRPKTLAVDRCPHLHRAVQAGLRRGWSPASIAGDMARTGSAHEAGEGCQGCLVSHEGIYTYVYAQPVSALARELLASGNASVLRTGRTVRRTGPRPAPAPRIKNPTYIDDRPAEAEGRTVPGHWEGDLVIGKAGKSALISLVERTSRFLILCPVPGSRDSPTVTQAVIAAAGGLPAQIKRTLTWDCGSELALHADVTATGLPVYFAHPHSPWERGSNENMNRIIREFFPKGTDITADPKYLAAVACEINDRPRKIHEWKKPSEIFAELVENASTV
ncbi:MAG: IS30 family transposase [Acidimicrobiales bacterium]